MSSFDRVRTFFQKVFESPALRIAPLAFLAVTAHAATVFTTGSATCTPDDSGSAAMEPLADPGNGVAGAKLTGDCVALGDTITVSSAGSFTGDPFPGEIPVYWHFAGGPLVDSARNPGDSWSFDFQVQPSGGGFVSAFSASGLFGDTALVTGSGVTSGLTGLLPDAWQLTVDISCVSCTIIVANFDITSIDLNPIDAVPEPSSLALFATAGAWIFWRRKRGARL